MQKELGETGTQAMSDGQENQKKGHDVTAIVTGARMPPSSDNRTILPLC